MSFGRSESTNASPSVKLSEQSPLLLVVMLPPLDVLLERSIRFLSFFDLILGLGVLDLPRVVASFGFLVVFLLVLRLVVPVVSVGLAAAAFGALLRLRPVFLPHPPLCFLPRPLCARSLELATGSSYSGDVPNGDVLKGGSLSLSAPLPPAERPRPLLAAERCARPLLAAERCPRPCLRPLSAVCCFLPAAECRPRPCLRPLSAVCSQSDADVSKADVSNSGDDSQCAMGDGRQRWTMCNKACELRSCPHQIKDCYAQHNVCEMRRL